MYVGDTMPGLSTMSPEAFGYAGVLGLLSHYLVPSGFYLLSPDSRTMLTCALLSEFEEPVCGHGAEGGGCIFLLLPELNSSARGKSH